MVDFSVEIYGEVKITGVQWRVGQTNTLIECEVKSEVFGTTLTGYGTLAVEHSWSDSHADVFRKAKSQAEEGKWYKPPSMTTTR